MQSANDDHCNNKLAINRLILFVLVWSIGSILSIVVCRYSSSHIALVHRFFYIPASTVDLIAVYSFPFLLTILAGRLYSVYFLYLFCFAKGFQYTFCVISVFKAFGAGGWLAQLLMLFADLFLSGILLVFWLNAIFYKKCLPLKAALIATTIGILIILLDTIYIAPFSFLLKI